MITETDKEKRDFAAAVRKLFVIASKEACAKYGGLSAFMYASPNPTAADDLIPNQDLVNGAKGFADLLEHPDYYLLTAGRDLIKRVKIDIATHFEAAFDGQKGMVVDLGPGPLSSVRAKLLPIIGAIGKDNIAGVGLIDRAEAYLTEAWRLLQQIGKNAFLTTPTHSPFEDIGSQLSDSHFENVMYLLLGNTGSNFAWNQTTPNPFIIQFFEHIRGLVEATGGRIVIEQDCNQDEASLLKAYDNPVAAKWMKNLLHRMVRDAGVKFSRPLDVEVSEFEYFARWNKETSCMEMGVKSTFDQTVTMGDETFEIKAGTELHMWNSHKYSTEHFGEMLLLAGFKSEAIYTDVQPGKPPRAAIHIVKPAMAA